MSTLSSSHARFAGLAGLAAAAALTLLASSANAAEPFTYDPPGALVGGSGKGRVDTKVYAPTLRFPMESGPAYANSQVWGKGGLNGGGGGQCDKPNYSYPWHDNYCESRSWEMPLCPSGAGHQGQDIRAATCVKDVHWVVAGVDGTITNVGSYSVYVTAADGTRLDYLHMSNVQVKVGQKVKRGERIGKVSNQFNGEATTVHLHFNIRQNIAGIGSVYVPTYLSLVKSYESMLGINQPDAAAPIVAEPTPSEPPKLQEVPVTVTEPTDPAELAPPPAMEDDAGGCTLQPLGTSNGTTSLGALALFASVLGAVAGRRRKARAQARR